MPQWTVFCEVVTLMIHRAHKILLMQIPFWLALSNPSYKWASYLRGEAFCGNTGGQTIPSTCPLWEWRPLTFPYCLLPGWCYNFKVFEMFTPAGIKDQTSSFDFMGNLSAHSSLTTDMYCSGCQHCRSLCNPSSCHTGGRNEQAKARSGSRPSAHTPKAPMASPLIGCPCWSPGLSWSPASCAGVRLKTHRMALC